MLVSWLAALLLPWVFYPTVAMGARVNLRENVSAHRVKGRKCWRFEPVLRLCGTEVLPDGKCGQTLVPGTRDRRDWADTVTSL